MSKSKSTDERSTPWELFNELNYEFCFTLDVCASDENTKCKRYFTKQHSGLLKDWSNEICFMNPPYSDIRSWLRKAYQENMRNDVVTVCILPCDTSTGWFHDFIWNRVRHEVYHKNIQLRFPRGRYKFGKYTTSPKFATIIAVFGHK